MAAVLALLASACWGTADFLGGSLTRRHPVATVLLAGQGTGLLVLAAVVTRTGLVTDPAGALGWGAAAGGAGAVALAAFYRALADGRMSLVAPIAATGVAVPVLAGLAAGERPSGLAVAGIATAALGVVLASGPELSGRAGARPVALALVAAAGFGTVLVCLDRGGAVDVTTALVATRVTATGLYAVAARVVHAPVAPRGRDLALAAATGLLDLAALALYTVASTDALVAVVAVLASLYPVVTALLARRVYGERLAPVQAAGVATALAGVVLLAAGGTG